MIKYWFLSSLNRMSEVIKLLLESMVSCDSGRMVLKRNIRRIFENIIHEKIHC